MHTNQTTHVVRLETNVLPAIDNFFDRYELNECQDEIWNLLSAYCGQENGEIGGPIARSNTVYFCRNIDTLLKELNKAWNANREVQFE